MKGLKVAVLAVAAMGMAAPVAFADTADLFAAIAARNPTKLAYELQYNWISDRGAVKGGLTPLMDAAGRDWQEGVEMILAPDLGVDVNARGARGETALLYASRECNDTEILKLLIRKNANLNAKDDDGNTILMKAVENNNEVILIYLLGLPGKPLLIRNNNGEDVFIVAARLNNGRAVTLLLKQNLDNFNRVSSDNKTAFMWACDNENVDMVRAIMDSGKVDMYMDLPAGGSRRAMPVLLWAIDTNKSRSILEEIIDYYTDDLDEIVDRSGHTALYYAVQRKNTAVQRLLRDKGLTIENAKNTQR